jgi:hypothetical protein
VPVPPSGPLSPEEEQGERRQGRDQIAADKISIAGRDKISGVLESGLDDGDVILAPTREDVLVAFRAVAGGPPILFGASAGSAWRAACAMLPGLEGESRRSSFRFVWLTSWTVLSLIGFGLVGLFFLNVSRGFVSIAAALWVVLVGYLLVRSYLLLQSWNALAYRDHKVMERLGKSRGMPRTGSSGDAESASAASPDKE